MTAGDCVDEAMATAPLLLESFGLKKNTEECEEVDIHQILLYAGEKASDLY